MAKIDTRKGKKKKIKKMRESKDSPLQFFRAAK
jgi:hypothetical protein